jgi:curved DNA-binding protein CbpA
MADHYAVLGVPRDATAAAVRTAYLRLARVTHPDVATDGAARFQAVQLAYEVLSDPATRAAHDSGGAEAVQEAFKRRDKAALDEGEGEGGDLQQGGRRRRVPARNPGRRFSDRLRQRLRRARRLRRAKKGAT